jgi:hypothetical protein
MLGGYQTGKDGDFVLGTNIQPGVKSMIDTWDFNQCCKIAEEDCRAKTPYFQDRNVLIVNRKNIVW